MIITCGDRKNFAISFQVSMIDESKDLWGGFEIWLNNVRFGDAYYYDIISGNNLFLIEKIVKDEIPKYPFPIKKEPGDIIKEVFSNYSSISLETFINQKQILIDSYHRSRFWGNFILLPNESQVFNCTRLIYFAEADLVNLMYTINEDDRDTGEFILERTSLQNVGNEFLGLHKEICEGNKKIEFTSRKVFH